MGKTKKHASVNQRKKSAFRLQSAELVTKDEMQEYAMVVKALGDRRFQCNCADGVKRVCKIRGKLRGRLFIQPHDILLISLREDEGDDASKKADIIQKYRPEEIHELKKAGEFTDRDFQDEDQEETNPTDQTDGLIVWTTEEIDAI